MAETSIASNNKSVSFRNKPEREMSTHQRMNAEGQKVDGGGSMAKPAAKTASWNSRGVSHSETPHREPAGIANKAPMKMKKPPKAARKTAKRAVNRGMISEKAAKKHLDGY